MTNFKQHLLAQKNVAGASCELGALAVIALPLSGIVVLRATREIAEYKNREIWNALVARAAAKLGYKKDRRCKTKWRLAA